MAFLTFSSLLAKGHSLSREPLSSGGKSCPLFEVNDSSGILMVPSPPQMIEEVSTRKEEKTTKTLVKNPAYKDWIFTASPPPVSFGSERLSH